MHFLHYTNLLCAHVVLEYAAPVWNPYLTSKAILALEKVQRRASRLALGQKRGEMAYEDRLRKVKWTTLRSVDYIFL